ncbi:MAG: acetoacetate decarboxylase family protein [Alphaproteobacteria bacterium]
MGTGTAGTAATAASTSAARGALPDGPGRWIVQGRVVEMPVVVRDASSGAVTWLVPSAAARRIVPAGLEVAEVLPGRTLFSLAVIDYRDNDLGDYGEVSMAFFVRPAGERASLPVPWLGNAVDFLRGGLGTWIWKLPVDQSFTCDAGSGIWGFPKSVERIEFEDTEGRRTCRLDMDGRRVLSLEVPRGGTRTMPDAPMTTWTRIDGRLHRTTFVSGASEVGFSLGGAALELGSHPLADELRSLGLPKRPLLCVWMGLQHARFEAPEPA